MRNRLVLAIAFIIAAVPSCVTTEGTSFSVTYTPGGKAVVSFAPSYIPLPVQTTSKPYPDAALLPGNTK
jgi:hypothetical protein